MIIELQDLIREDFTFIMLTFTMEKNVKLFIYKPWSITFTFIFTTTYLIKIKQLKYKA
jgi:hypothetical protein